jgi:hypothetical protein
VINGVEDSMGCAADPVKSMAPPMVVETLRTGSMAYSGAGNFSDVASIGCPVEKIGLQEAKGNRECALIRSRGNMFAKKINIGDNFSDFSEYINKYIHFVYALKERGIKLMPRLIKTKGFLKRC